VTIEDRGTIGSDEQQRLRPVEEAGTKKHQTGDARPMSGRPPKHESRAREFRQELSVWKRTPISLRPSLHALGDKLGTTHQTLSYHLNRLDRWQAEEEGKRIHARARDENRGMTIREWYDVEVVPGLLQQIEELRQAAKRGPLHSDQVKMLKLFVRQGWPGAEAILEKCRQMTPQEEEKARAAEKATMFSAAAVKHIKRIKQEAERGPLPWRDIEILKILARRKSAEAKELLEKYSKSAMPLPQVPR
jgi:hypothetical protein